MTTEPKTETEAVDPGNLADNAELTMVGEFLAAGKEFEAVVDKDVNAFTRTATASRCVWPDGTTAMKVLMDGIGYLTDLRDTLCDMNRNTAKAAYVPSTGQPDRAADILAIPQLVEADSLSKRVGALRHPLYLAIEKAQACADWKPKAGTNGARAARVLADLTKDIAILCTRAISKGATVDEVVTAVQNRETFQERGQDAEGLFRITGEQFVIAQNADSQGW